MKTIAALLVISASLGLDSNGNQAFEVFLSLCFLAGGLYLSNGVLRVLPSALAGFTRRLSVR